MLTETFGGTCPNCGYDRMMMRYGTHGYFHYDACPNCAFAFGSNQIDTDENFYEGDFWINYPYKRVSSDDVQEIIVEELLYIESLPEPDDEKSSVFVYDENLEAKKY